MNPAPTKRLPQPGQVCLWRESTHSAPKGGERDPLPERRRVREPPTTAEFLKTYIYGVPDHRSYLALFGEEHLQNLREPASGKSP